MLLLKFYPHSRSRRVSVVGEAFLKTTETEKILVRLFDEDDEPIELGGSDTLTFTLKPRGLRDTDPLTINGTPTLITGTEYDYEIEINAYTDLTQDLLGLGDASTATDKTSVPCDGALVYTASGEDPIESETLAIALHSSIPLDTDGTPLASADPEASWLPRLPFTTVTGSAAGTSLDGLVTVDEVTTGALAITVVAGVVRLWQLSTGTDAENAAGGIVRPDDYAASTNERVWRERTLTAAIAWGAITGTLSAQTDLQAALDAKAAKAITVKIAGGAYTVGTTDPNELYGGVIYVTGAATITIPAVAAGQSFTVITIGAIAVSVDPNAADLIVRDGTAQADGEKITNLSTEGDLAVFTYYNATGWHAATNAWTNGG